MKNVKSLFPVVSIALLCFFSVWPSTAADCLAQPFLQLTDAHQQLIQTLTQRVKDMTPAIQVSPRWNSIANPADRVITASAEWKRSLALANSLAGQFGPLTTEAHSLVLKQARVIANPRKPLDEVGKGVAALARHPDLAGNDELLGRCIREPSQPTVLDPTNPKLSAWDPSRSHFVAKNYTEAEYFSDWHELIGDPISANRAQVSALMWRDKLPDANTGAIAEVAIAARLKRRGHTGIVIGADEISGNPLNGAMVDVSTDTEMYQVGLRASTIRNKINENVTDLASGIKRATDASPGKPYYFGFTLDDWSPTQGHLDALNNALKAAYAADIPPRLPPHTFSSTDFKYFSLEVDT